MQRDRPTSLARRHARREGSARLRLPSRLTRIVYVLDTADQIVWRRSCDTAPGLANNRGMWFSRGGAGAMVHGRIETTPQEQLEELRRAHARYIRLADELKDASGPEADPEDRKAREEDARRIAHAYERTIANAAARMAGLERMGSAHAPFAGRGMMLGLGLGVAAAAAIGLLAFLRPAIFHPGSAPAKLVAQIAHEAAPRPLGARQIDRFAATQPEIPDKTNDSASFPLAALTPPPNSAKQNIQPPKPTGRVSAKIETPSQAPPPAIVIPKSARPPRNPTRTLPTAAAPSSGAIPQPSSSIASAATPSLSMRDAAQAPPNVPQVSSSIVPQPQTTPVISRAGTPPDSPLPSIAAAQPPPTIIPETPVQTEALPPLAPAKPPPRQLPGPAIEAPVALEPVANTHMPPPYPAMSLRLGEQGTTRIRVSISTRGAITGCRVIDSSGSDRLDNAACSYVQQRWRWKPPMRGGRAVTAETQISVIWSLRRVP
jgi:periplasmic protein TonB